MGNTGKRLCPLPCFRLGCVIGKKHRSPEWTIIRSRTIQQLPQLVHGLAVDDSQILSFAARHRSGTELPEEPSGDKEAIVAPGNAYATLAGQRRAISLEYRLLSGNGFVVPYAYRPLLWWQPASMDGKDSIIVEYPSLFSVLLSGHHLVALYQRLMDHRVTWVRECSEVESLELGLAITRMEILRCYPSREEGSV